MGPQHLHLSWDELTTLYQSWRVTFLSIKFYALLFSYIPNSRPVLCKKFMSPELSQ